MAGVFRDVLIEWDGVDYTVTPSNRLLRSIEGQGVNIMQVMADLSAGNAQISNLAFITAAFLRAGGAHVTEDEVYGEMLTGDDDRLGYYATRVAEAMMPKGPDEKKPAAPAASKSRARAKPKQKPPKASRAG